MICVSFLWSHGKLRYEQCGIGNGEPKKCNLKQLIMYRAEHLGNLWLLKFNAASCRTLKDLSKKPILYGDDASPPVRFVMITASLLGVDLDFHNIDLFKGKNKTEFYKKINPLQKVPALSVEGEIICDSHAIALYLCGTTASQDLYPADNMMKAKVDQMLYFNATTLFPIDSAIFNDYFGGKWPADETLVKQWYSAIDYLELHLLNNKWLAGNKMQLCDICCAMTLSSLGILCPPLERHVKIKQWMKNLERVPSFEINRRGVRRLQLFVEKFGPACANSVV